MDPHSAPSLLGTTSAHYDANYYASHLGSDEPFTWESATWREWSRRAAERLCALLEPSSVLDVGCARGLLVQAFVERGVDAYGVDISEHAVETAHEDVRDRLRAVSATEPFGRRYDVVTCIEVLEHMDPAVAQQAIDNMTAAADRVVLSSSFTDFAEPTHVNVHQPADWAAWFAERGFFRRTDADLGFITPWAVCFERAELTRRDVVHRYESQLAPMRTELIEVREALLAASATGRETLERDLLKARDHAVGLEAQVARLETDLAARKADVRRLRGRVKELQAEVQEIRSSRTWKVGRAVLAPATGMRRQGRR